MVGTEDALSCPWSVGGSSLVPEARDEMADIGIFWRGADPPGAIGASCDRLRAAVCARR
jgi:hypothetical protein